MTDTQNSAGVTVGAIERWCFKWLGHDHGTHHRMPDGYWTPWHIAAARITELEAHIAAEPDRIREVVERCAKVADDYVADGEPDGHGARGEYYAAQSIAAAIRAQEIKP